MNIPTDSELWTRFKAGDRNAFSILYKRYFPAMYAYGSSLSIDTDYVKDAIQEVFMNLYFNNKIEIVGNSLKFYLLRAVKNKLLDILRGKKESIDISECEYTFTINFTIEDKIMEDEEYSSIKKRVSEMLSTLTNRQKEIMYLRYIEEMDYETIARLMDMKVQSVRNIIHKSVDKLKSLNPDEYLYFFAFLHIYPLS